MWSNCLLDLGTDFLVGTMALQLNCIHNTPAAREARDPRKTQVTLTSPDLTSDSTCKQPCLTCMTTEQVTTQLYRTTTAFSARPLNRYTLR